MEQRTSATSPTSMATSAYYNDPIYVGKNCYYKGNPSYQCVYYANARSSEIAGKPITYWSGTSTKEDVENPIFNRYGLGNAKDWLNDTLWETGTVPKPGCILVYGSAYGGNLGHVRLCEAVNGDKLIYSAANENGKLVFNKEIYIPKVSATGFLGVIYNPYVNEEEDIKSDMLKIYEIAKKYI